MVGNDDFLRQFFDQASVEEAFFAIETQANNNQTNAGAKPSPETSSVSLMITNRQRAQLRALGFSDEAIRSMTPAEAHEQLGLTESDR